MHNHFPYIRKRIQLVLLILCALCVVSIPGIFAWAADTTTAAQFYNKETHFSRIIQDDALLLDGCTNEELDKLHDIMDQMTAYTNVVFYSTYDNPYSSVSTLARNYCDSLFGSNSVDAVAFIFDMDNRDLFLYASGDISYTITNSVCNSIADNVYRKASSGDYIGCVTLAFTQANRVVKGDGVPQPMKYISNAFLAVLLAMLLNYALVRRFSARHTPGREEIINGIYKQTNVANAAKTFVNSSKTYSPQTSSSSGSGHSGGGFSGGGGGGGHSSGGGHHF